MPFTNHLLCKFRSIVNSESMSDTDSQLREYIINASLLSCNVTIVIKPQKNTEPEDESPS